jgi:hypothetical protein
MTSIRYQVGGTVPPDDSSYVTRDSDRQLFEALKAGAFCYVLNSRQMGKSSLMVRTLTQLQESGWKGIILDFSAKGSQSDQPNFWYNGIVNELNDEFKLLEGEDFLKWLTERDFISPVERLGEFIEAVLLPGINEPIIIFVDEIDSTLGLPFTDDFFALIRACYNRRAEKPDYKRLTFALLGVAAPSELIGDTKRTPFNIGTSINLSGFTLAEAQPLAAGLAEKSDHPQAVLEAILFWTGGQPFLTQRLCQLVADSSIHLVAGHEYSMIEELVRSRVIENWESQDEPQHLRTIRDRILKNDVLSFDSLKLYKNILENNQIDADNSHEQINLKLSGLVLEEQGQLKPYNRIYKEIFNENWVENERIKLRLYVKEFEDWKTADLRRKQRYLLYGKKCDEVQKWRDNYYSKGGRFDETEGEFLTKSKHFWAKIQEVIPAQFECNREVIIQTMNYWTGGLEEFNDRVIKLITLDSKEGLKSENEKNWLDSLVESQLGYFRQYDLFQKDCKQFTTQNDVQVDLYSLILDLEAILKLGQIDFNDQKSEHHKLKDMCFIFKKDGDQPKLQILNKVYEKLLDQNWVNDILAIICPYIKPFKDWQDSDYREQSYLLQGQDLKRALDWIQNKPQLNPLEIEFIMTSLVWEAWQVVESNPTNVKAVELIKKARPKLQTKTNFVDQLIREILEWTKPKFTDLEKVLQLVSKSEIPAENYSQWIESLVRSHLKSCNAQQLSEYIDFKHPYNQRWQELKKCDKNFFSTLDRFISQENINLDEETLKRLKETLDTNPPLSENLNRYGTVTNFHELVCSFLYEKLSKVNTMIGQKEFDKLLDGIVTNAGGDLESILIFDLTEGLALYGNRELKTSNPPLYFALFGDGDVGGEAIKGFNYLLNIESALSNFGGKTGRGDLSYSIFKLKEGSMMVYFVKIDIPIAICFIAAEGINIGNLRRHGASNISKIQDAIS